MKEIKAYVRPGPLAQVIDRLEKEGARDLAVTRVDAIGALANTEDDGLQREHKYREHYSDVAKVEIVCADADVDRFVAVLRDASANGARSDGRIFVLNVEQAVNVGDDGGKKEAL
jgi:nitrogen regulatory protein PII